MSKKQPPDPKPPREGESPKLAEGDPGERRLPKPGQPYLLFKALFRKSQPPDRSGDGE